MNFSSVQKKLEKIIVESVLKFINPKGIILYGGYGRDEGSWVIGKDKKLKPYNDFDILLVLEKELHNDIVNQIKKNIKSHVSIRWIDISQIKPFKLEKLKNSIFNYDLKYDSKVLYGDKKLQNIIPDFESSKIPLKDIDILFRTRIWTLVGCFHDKSFDQITGSHSMFFRNQMAKAVLAGVDSCLIMEQQYHYSYKKRVKFFLNFNKYSEYFDLVNWALDEKLRPKDTTMSSNEVRKIYFLVVDFFIKCFFKGLSRYYKKRIDNDSDIEKIYLYNPKNFVIRKIKNILNKPGDKNAYMTVIQFMCVSYLMKRNEKTLNRIKYLSKKIGVIEESFEKLRLRISMLRLS